jgi:hypothetical protein
MTTAPGIGYSVRPRKYFFVSWLVDSFEWNWMKELHLTGKVLQMAHLNTEHSTCQVAHTTTSRHRVTKAPINEYTDSLSGSSKQITLRPNPTSNGVKRHHKQSSRSFFAFTSSFIQYPFHNTIFITDYNKSVKHGRFVTRGIGLSLLHGTNGHEYTTL